jgi:hypothetical protein
MCRPGSELRDRRDACADQLTTRIDIHCAVLAAGNVRGRNTHIEKSNHKIPVSRG